MKEKIIIITMDMFHPWNPVESERTETVVIPNDEYADINASNLISLFIREILELDELASNVAESVNGYTITNEYIEYPIEMPAGEWLAVVTAEYSDIKQYNQPDQGK